MKKRRTLLKPDKPCRRCGQCYWYEGEQNGRKHLRCAACARAATIRWHRENPNIHHRKSPEKRRAEYAERKAAGKTHAYHLWKNHKLLARDYERLLQKQKGVCAICSSTCSTGRRLSVDHDHKTGQVRGLLCTKCNLFVGIMEKNPKLTEALRYLRKRRKTKLRSMKIPNYRPVGATSQSPVRRNTLNRP